MRKVIDTREYLEEMAVASRLFQANSWVYCLGFL